MKKLDGRSKEARALKAKKAARAKKLFDDKHITFIEQEHESDAPLVIGGIGLTGKQYAPLGAATPASAMSEQRGGDHYKNMVIQPMEFSFRNKLDPAQHTAIKYITRFRSKGGREDLEKAKHVIDMLIELEYGL